MSPVVSEIRGGGGARNSPPPPSGARYKNTPVGRGLTAVTLSTRFHLRSLLTNILRRHALPVDGLVLFLQLIKRNRDWRDPAAYSRTLLHEWYQHLAGPLIG